jgi:hypothetical protein
LQHLSRILALSFVCKNLRSKVQAPSHVENDFLWKQVITCPFLIPKE